jgi:NADH-quinone oxidoreductase subunit F
MIVGGLALNSVQGYIYLRGEFAFAGRQLAKAIRQAYERGYLGADVMGSGKRFDLTLHRGRRRLHLRRGDGAARLARGPARPAAAASAVPGDPRAVRLPDHGQQRRVDRRVPFLVRHGVDWFRQWGTEKSPGPKLIGVSGNVANPGNYEVALGTPMREIVEIAGGMAEGHELKFWCPGGSSTPLLPAAAIDTPYTFEDIAEQGSMLGTGALMIYSDQVCVVDTVLRFTEFYEHESCGKCTPCREGGYWLSQILRRIETGTGREEDLDLLEDICDNIFGRSFCALGDGMTSPIVASLKHFRDEYVEHLRQGRCPLGTTEPRRDIPMLAVGDADVGNAQVPTFEPAGQA